MRTTERVARGQAGPWGNIGLAQRAFGVSVPLAAPASVHEVLHSPGQSLDDVSRRFMEGRFGHDFGRIRIHTDARAAESAAAVNALAYTVGDHVVFADTKWQPHSEAGRRLLAHELTHTIQQRQNSAGNSVLQRNSGAPPGNQPSSQPTTQPPTTPSPCDQAVAAMKAESLQWLDDAYNQLLHYESDEVFSDVLPVRPEHSRIRGNLQETFHTTDLTYVEVIRRRLLHVANTLRQSGAVTVHCGGHQCNVAGSSFTAAYVESPYELTMCTGTSGGAPSASAVETFIHELIHAVVPQIGISNPVTQGTGVTDRAYRHERVFRYLTPEEALDNADSYAVLTSQLFHQQTTSAVTAPTDTTQGCSAPDQVLEAFARADQWNGSAHSWLQSVISHLQHNNLSGVADLHPDDAARITTLFPNASSIADLRVLERAFGSLASNGFGTNWDFGCVTSSLNCASGTLTFGGGGVASGSSITRRAISVPTTVQLCPDWLTASADDQIRSIYAAFLISRPSWIITDFQLANTMDYINFARQIAVYKAPPPTTRSASEHIRADMPPSPPAP